MLNGKSPRYFCVTLQIANCLANRILMDTGNSIDVLYYYTFSKMSCTKMYLVGESTTFIGFTRNAI